MRWLVCGGRNFSDFSFVCKTLDEIADTHGWPRTIIHGGAKGADTLAGEFAGLFESIRVEVFRAEWDKYGPKAGSIRNQQMIDEGRPDLVIAFPGGAGTADMVRRARNAGIEVIEV